ncbi:hypothetical protein ACT6QG_09340 [Xanthobacter sp. TB0136]|uniref:hypothetical protein n=1 Tax=Xanthobacter sp. TB0136 TaxID=3459177 RepID=UPI0040397BE3
MRSSRDQKPESYEYLISLGQFCVTRYQITRHLESLHIRPPGTFLFDWQVTPPEALLTYFREDFRGVFELEDLEIGPEGCARHKHLLTSHPHQFGEHVYDLTPERMVELYPIARQRFDYLAGKFRTQLRTRNMPTLYVISRFLDDDQTERLVQALGRYHRQWHVAMISPEGEPPSPRPEITTIAIDPDIPGGWRWEGHDAEWTRALSRFPVKSPPKRSGLGRWFHRVRNRVR